MQRELRLGDILDDYCPRERRLTNHAVVAMIGQEVKQTRCTTCDAEHEYKHAKVPRQRRKSEAPAALYSQVLAGAPKRVTHDALPEPEGRVDAPAAVVDIVPDAPVSHPVDERSPVGLSMTADEAESENSRGSESAESPVSPASPGTPGTNDAGGPAGGNDIEGPVHRPLIRATLPRPEGQMPPARPAPDFTIRQPGGRPGRFRFRQQRGQNFQGNRSNGNMGNQSRGPRHSSGRPPQGSMTSRMARRHDSGRKRSK
jgi:hypothetical protein